MPFENSTPLVATKCVRCLDRGHDCYAARIIDGKTLCAFCMDGEPCIYEQRNKANPGQTAPAPEPIEPEEKENQEPRMKKSKIGRVDKAAIEVEGNPFPGLKISPQVAAQFIADLEQKRDHIQGVIDFLKRQYL